MQTRYLKKKKKSLDGIIHHVQYVHCFLVRRITEEEKKIVNNTGQNGLSRPNYLFFLAILRD